MPTPVTNNLNSGKHWTKEELEAREAAVNGMKRRRVSMKPPSWLSEDALQVWKDITRKLKGIELLDNLDSELLAIYCDAIVNYRKCSREMVIVGDDGAPVAQEDVMKATQAWARIVTTYADKLGLTPGGRARLAKKKAEKTVDPFENTFGG